MIVLSCAGLFCYSVNIETFHRKTDKTQIEFPDQSLDPLALNSLPASSDFCRLLIIFTNSLDPDQARQAVGQYRSGSKLFDFVKKKIEKVYL